ncbi:hypothetical protein BDV96DRAFT_602996 [Lophiotrema nucula]|uniref:Uncharacterized protein n=1 Tax=Lophiotrema nucula TaxID=690887 RepID=A0A6A5YX69_9PLEO|nr:hypothetical protein BDV96DRAFT_602996 [Lophiotrema nucula]
MSDNQWIWSAEHGDHYKVLRSDGSYDYIWSRATHTRLDPGDSTKHMEQSYSSNTSKPHLPSELLQKNQVRSRSDGPSVSRETSLTQKSTERGIKALKARPSRQVQTQRHQQGATNIEPTTNPEPTTDLRTRHDSAPVVSQFGPTTSSANSSGVRHDQDVQALYEANPVSSETIRAGKNAVAGAGLKWKVLDDLDPMQLADILWNKLRFATVFADAVHNKLVDITEFESDLHLLIEEFWIKSLEGRPLLNPRSESTIAIARRVSSTLCSRGLKTVENQLPGGNFNKHCGDQRWMDVPRPFGDRLYELVQAASNSSNDGDVSSSVVQTMPETQSAPQMQAQHRQLPGTISLASLTANTSDPSASNGQTAVVITGRILFVVESGDSLELTQIPVHGKRTIDFFRNLRSDYFKLRGYWRTHLSVWRFSHRDFYSFVKWDAFSYAPHKKNEYPDPRNKDYVYDPCPPEIVPPVSEHEFRCRFRSCAGSKPTLLHHISNRLFGKRPSLPHSDELLKYIPKKVSQLDESNEERETFWTPYARQRISLIGVVAYVLVCLLMPALWFFFMWLFGWNHRADLQGASILLSLTLGALSLFMSVLLSSMRFGRDE